MNKTHMQRLSTLMSLSCVTLMVALPVITIWYWLNFEVGPQTLPITATIDLDIQAINSWQIVCAAAYSLLSTLVVVYTLSQLKLLFENFRRGQIFTDDSVKAMHRFGIGLFVSAIFKVLNTIVLSVLLTLSNGPNQKTLVVSFGSNEFWIFFTALVFLAISWSFKEGRQLSEENASFV